MKMLIINPGSTSTKVGIYEGERELCSQNLRHDIAELDKFANIVDQYEWRKVVVMQFLQASNVKLEELVAIVARGGIVKPLVGGTYKINRTMLQDLRAGLRGTHASNLGALIAYEIAKDSGLPSFVVDPVVVDELDDVARISGHPLFERRSIFHALNQKAMAREYCKIKGLQYDSVNLIVVHMGGGISVGFHKAGNVVDVNNALDGEGPFSPERSGGLPVGELVNMCFGGKYTKKDIRDMILGKGGMVAYFGSNDIKALEKDALEGDHDKKQIIDAMIYQVSKEIGAMSTVAKGKVDGIVFTGGIAYSDYITSSIRDRVQFIAPVTTMPGEDEMKALAQGAMRVLGGFEEAKEY